MGARTWLFSKSLVIQPRGARVNGLWLRRRRGTKPVVRGPAPGSPPSWSKRDGGPFWPLQRAPLALRTQSARFFGYVMGTCVGPARVFRSAGPGLCSGIPPEVQSGANRRFAPSTPLPEPHEPGGQAAQWGSFGPGGSLLGHRPVFRAGPVAAAHRRRFRPYSGGADCGINRGEFRNTDREPVGEPYDWTRNCLFCDCDIDFFPRTRCNDRRLLGDACNSES